MKKLSLKHATEQFSYNFDKAMDGFLADFSDQITIGQFKALNNKYGCPDWSDHTCYLPDKALGSISVDEIYQALVKVYKDLIKAKEQASSLLPQPKGKNIVPIG